MATPRRALLVLAIVAGLASAPATAGAKTVWLCKPGLRNDPCAQRLDMARYTPVGELLGADDAAARPRRRIDCFYVYPTVSDQQAATATRRVDPELRSIARFQAARFSGVCRVFAPVYRQVTIKRLFTAAPADWKRAYRDVRAAWHDYLARHNRGRGVVLIGHSQGTFHLRDLIAAEIERRRELRRRLVSALLLGGNVTVAQGRDVGGDFRRVRACRSDAQLGCVVAFSTYNGPVAPEAIFGRTAAPGRAVLCTNPAALGGGTAPLDPIYPREPFAPGTAIAAVIAAIGFPVPEAAATWLAFPDSFTGRCVDEGGATVLQVAPAPGAPPLTAVPPGWGLHLADANIALGNLEALVRRQAAAYRRERP